MKRLLTTVSVVLLTALLLTTFHEASGQGQGQGNGNGPPGGAGPPLVPIGVVLPYAGTPGSLPNGWLLCDGSAINRVEYDELFQLLGVSHGHGDMAMTFNLPDYRGRFLRGVDQGQGRDPEAAARTAMNPGGNVGDSVGSVQDDAMQSHRHDDAGHSHFASAEEVSHSHDTTGHSHAGVTDFDVHSHSMTGAGDHSHFVTNSLTGGFMSVRDGGGQSSTILDSTDTEGPFLGNLRTTISGAHVHGITPDAHSHSLLIEPASETVLPTSHTHAITVFSGLAALGDPTDSGTGAGLPKHGLETRPENACVHFIIKARR